jgi:ferric-dicitrate binding protein FerR (iron transport regulator)
VKKEGEHIDLKNIDQKSKAFFAGGKFVWKKSEADVWAELEARLSDRNAPKIIFLNSSHTKWLVAAGIAILLSIGGFMRFYTVTVQAIAGQHLETRLPDQSEVKLNAESSISYHPYWWKINRQVKFEGEAFFKVEKGRKFTVVSRKGLTQVLGTSFNIFAREEIYKVVCITGTVRVKSKQGNEAIIKSNSKAEIKSNGQIDVLTNIETYPEISWRRNIFLFTATPVREVFSEIERQYGVKIDIEMDDNSLYTGNFTKDQNVEEILEYVCPAMGFRFARKSAGEYVIIPGNE